MSSMLMWTQNFGSGGVIVTGIYGNDSSVTFEGIEGTGQPQWVSFYYQSKLYIHLCFGDFV